MKSICLSIIFLLINGLPITELQAETGNQPSSAVDANNLARSTEKTARNIILLIGDGMDDQQITIARNYLKGATGQLTLDKMPYRSAAQVLTVSESNPHRAVYVADSANSATSIATGEVTSRGRIATSAGDNKDLTTIVELASAAGIKTGLVSTSSVTDATVAAFYAHISLRACTNPLRMNNSASRNGVRVDCISDMKSNGGPGSIAEQLVESDLDLVLGGGMDDFITMAKGQTETVRSLAETAGFTVITSISELNAAPLDKKWLGLFAPGTLPVRLQGEGGRAAEKPPGILNRIIKRDVDAALPAPMSCESNPAFKNTPSLKLLTDRALVKLSNNNKNGFFLMIESASIDKQSHERKACGSIGEVEQLDESLQIALAFANDNPQTLVLVTADHGHAAQLIPDHSMFSPAGVPINTPGKMVRLRTPDNAIMAINYATNDFAIEEHTGVQVPVLSNQTGRVPAMLTQPELFTILESYLNL